MGRAVEPGRHRTMTSMGARRMPLTDHPIGGYRFLPGIAPYSCGVVSAPGFEIVHVTLHRPVPYRRGFEVIERHLASEGRPRAALCGVELRSPVPVQLRGLRRVQRRVCPHPGGLGPVRRGREPGRPHQRRPRGRSARRAGAVRVLVFEALRPVAAADLRRRRGGGTARGRPGRRGDRPCRGHFAGRHRRQGDVRHGPHGAPTAWARRRLARRHRHRHLHRPPDRAVAPRGHPGTGRPGGHARIRWFYSRPPIVGIEYEMDLRGVRTELRIG